ncbi:hypothetical protein N7532_006653 [Penicillium argentinense]|uniref:Hydrophobin n=1 Tax=Penicillium argentinense TaxID=1131581 RepID=A0A9W9FGN8_9EURO|nr:uncharacterized protein N7532_006653 [Penicillium argentinense]KAJ5099652.1 hypothetical protein N7532_006653 [Penicillium argentinense]
MRLAVVLPTLATLTMTSAVPVVQDRNPMPTPTQPAVQSASTATPTPSASATPVGPYTCPQKQTKKCCMSLSQTSKNLMKPLGDLLPILRGVQISSSVSFQCRDMRESEAPDHCVDDDYSPMCCINEITEGIDKCKPFALAKEEYYRTFGYGQESQVDLINDVV